MTRTLLTAALILCATQAHALPNPGVGCAPSAEAAVARLLNGTASTGSSDGFRVDSVHHDHLRNRSWAVVASCSEPSRPRVAVLLPGTASLASAAMASPVIHPGDRVTVLSHSGDSQMQLLGWAQEAGAESQIVHVRLGLSLDADHPSLALRCRVLKPGVVEVAQ